MNLLLQVDNIFILWIDIGILTELSRILLLLLLATEVHCHSRIVVAVIAKGATAPEISATFQSSAAYTYLNYFKLEFSV